MHGTEAMNRRPRQSGRDSGAEWLSRTARRQQNLIWPSAIYDGRLVALLALKNLRDATPVQKLGVALFALGFLTTGLIVLSMAKAERSVPVAIVAYILTLGGAWLLWNALRRPRRPSRERGHR